MANRETERLFPRAPTNPNASPGDALDADTIARVAAQADAAYRAARPERARAGDAIGQRYTLARMENHLEVLCHALDAGSFGYFAEYMGWASHVLAWLGIERAELAESLRLAAQAAEAELVGEVRDGAVECLMEAARLVPEATPTPPELARVAPRARLEADFRDTAHCLMATGDDLARLAILVYFARHPHLSLHHGAAGRKQRLVDMGRLVQQLSHSLGSSSVDSLGDYLSWYRCCLDADAGVWESVEEFAKALCLAGDMALDPEHARAMREFMDQGLEHLEGMESVDAVSYIDGSTDTGEVARRYLDLLLAGDRRRASQLILDEVDGGLSIERTYLEVFQVVQYEIGRLWQRNEITVAHEHFCTAATQMIMSQLYPRILATEERCNKTMVATCVSDDLHEIGVRMVCDFFEMAGWDTFYLGSNTPLDAILASVRERHADLLAVSTTLAAHVGLVDQLISAVRADPACARVRIMVGGLPFMLDTELWQKVGADGFARDAASAVGLGEHLTAV